MGKNYCKIEHKWCKYASHNCCHYIDKVDLHGMRMCPKWDEHKTVSLRSILKSTSWEDIKNALLKWHPDEVKNLNGYFSVYCKLLTIKGVRTRWFIDIRKIYDGFEDKYWLAVSGYYYSNKEKTFGLDFVSWNEWVNMNISKSTLDNFSYAEIASESLFEMTYHGFDETSPEEFKNELIHNLKEMQDGNY